MAERQFGPYRLVRQLAVGGMAEIHLAKTKGIAGFEKYVALKMIHPNFAEDEQFVGMLVDEAKIAVQLNHGNIAQTFDLGRVGNIFYITMEYVDGADLYKILCRGADLDFEMPLDVCAFIAKQVASALDHAHRKRDHSGKMLGIVHRDVSPQNVLISYSGEVKLVDFGIAKATMKARQTAVGVIKGKYYYMSPEQAWGESIDFRSDIFSAGIVLYEMMTGQMLYLEEDLHKLLRMARNADIAPPSTLRKGIPPQLERIVMHALDKDRNNRYQSAADFATDLERFLHAYSPVFTPTKVAALVRQIVGTPIDVPYDAVAADEESSAAHTLTSDDLILDAGELHDDNSVIFRVADLKPKRPTGSPEGRATRHAEIDEVADTNPQQPPRVAPLPSTKSAGARPAAKPRDANEETRPVPSAARTGARVDSGLLEMRTGEQVDATLITGAPIGLPDFMSDTASEDVVDATIVSVGPPVHDDTEASALDDAETLQPGRHHASDEDGPTLLREFRGPPERNVGEARRPAPPALAAKIHAPAVSELRKPRASRKTPKGGVPAANVLRAIVGARPSEAMPTPRPGSPGERIDDSGAMTIPQQPSPVAGHATPPPESQSPFDRPYNGYDASGLPTTPPEGSPVYHPPHPTPQQPPYPGYSPQGYPQVSPSSFYGLQHPAAPPQPLSVTGQMRLLEADEIASEYKVTGSMRWIKLVIAGVMAGSFAAGVTFFIIRAMRDTPPRVASVRVESVPPGAEVIFDDTRLAGTTPLSIDSVPVGTRHDVRVELTKHKPDVQKVDIPTTGRDVTINAFLTEITGRIRVVSRPDGAEVRLDSQLRGHTPMTIMDLDMASVKVLELRLKDYQPYVKNLEWPASGEIDVDATLVK